MRPVLRCLAPSLSVVLLVAGAGCDGCRSGAGPAADAATREGESEGEGEGDAATPPLLREAGTRFRDASPGLELPDGAVRGGKELGPIDPACTGAEIDLAVAVFDVRCAITAADAKRLRVPLEVDAGGPRFRQEAVREADGRVLVRVVSLAKTPMTLPLSYHGKLPAFTALAEDEKHQLFELAPPALGNAGKEPETKPRFARIVLAPGGVAIARATVTNTVVRRIVPKCGAADGGEDADYGVGALPAGPHTLYVDQLVIDVEAGAPAKVAWNVP